MTEENHLKLDFPIPSLNDFGEKTFLGGKRLSTRTVLFFLFGLFTIVLFAGMFFVADMRLSSAQSRLEASRELMELAASVENSAWRIRVDEKNFLLRKKPQHIDSHKVNINRLTEVLNTLYAHAASSPIKEHITTINEGLAQYATEFEATVATEVTPGKTSELAKQLRASALDIETRIAETKIEALIKAMAQVRNHEKNFVQRSDMKDLVKLNKSSTEFAALLSASPLPEENKALIGNLLKVYQGNMSAYAKSRLKQDRQISRLDEIFAYIAPSVAGLSSFADGNLTEAARNERLVRDQLRVSLPASGVAILIAVMLFALSMMRSIAAPVRDLADASRRMTEGEDNVEIPILGNRDEVGDIARAMVKLRAKFAEIAWNQETSRKEASKEEGEESKEDKKTAAEIVQLRSDLEEATKKADKGEAAMAEAGQLRTDMEALKSATGKGAQVEEEARRLRAELDQIKKEVTKGETAQIEAALLRIDLEATKAELERTMAEAKKAKETMSAARARNLPVPQAASTLPEPFSHKELTGQITSASRQLAHSSQSVSSAALDADRTGAMINSLKEVTEKIGEVDALLATISDQTNFLVPQADSGDVSHGEADSNLVVLTSDYKKASGQGHVPPKDQAISRDEAIGQRFDAIRATTNQATWTMKDVAAIIHEVKDVASEIAAASSAEALEITTELLEQSEHLREMLDSLVNNIQGGEASYPEETAEPEEETVAQADPVFWEGSAAAPEAAPAPEAEAEAAPPVAAPQTGPKD